MKFICKSDEQTKLLHMKLLHRPHIGEYIKYDSKLYKIIKITHIASDHPNMIVEVEEEVEANE